MDVGLHIKLGLDYGILILIYHVLGLINWAYILAINLETLNYNQCVDPHLGSQGVLVFLDSIRVYRAALG